MSGADNEQLLAQERAAADTDAALAANEQALWQRANVVETEPSPARVQNLLNRITAMQNAGVQSADLVKAANVLKAALAADPPLATAERVSALGARKAALQAREGAAQALTAATTQVEAARATHRKNLASVENYLAALEKRSQGTPAPAGPASRPAAAAPAAPVSNPARPTAPSPAPGPTPMTTPQQRMPAAPTAARSAPEMTANTARKLSRRRRVRLAPPPKRLEVEVATYGDNTFYTGFDNKIATGGLFVASLETLPAGHELDLVIDLEGKQIKSRGKVDFVRLDNSSNSECTQGAGIKLTTLSSSDASAIEAFFNSRPPMFVATGS